MLGINFKAIDLSKWSANIRISENTVKSFIHTFWHLVGTLLPLLIVIILSILFCKMELVEHFIKEGDFCLFSAAILTPASYILSQFSRDESRIVRRWPSFLYACSIVIILITSMMFAGVFVKSIFSNASFNYQIFETWSIIFLVLSIIIFFIAQRLNLKYGEFTDAKEIEKQNLEELGSEFDQLTK